jgi:diketogulonate reductase-like aldo/keto reductase
MDNYKKKYLKYKKKYLQLINQTGGSDICLKNYHSSLTEKGATGRTDCWADSGIFLLFGNPRLRNLILENNADLKQIFDTMLKGDVIDFVMRNKLLEYFKISEDELMRYGDPFKFIFNVSIQKIIIDNKILFTMAILDTDINKIINKDGINYKLHSCSVINYDHFLSIFECKDKWHVADNTVPNLVDYDLESGYTPKAEESFDKSIIGKNYNLKNKLQGFYLYLPVDLEPVQLEPIDSLQEMPQLCLGTSNWSNKDGLKDIIKKAIDIGYRHFDGAVVYESQSAFGVGREEYYQGFKEGIIEGLSKNNLQRKDIWITFKSSITSQIDYIKSRLSELQYIDLWLYHHKRNESKEKLIPNIQNGFVKNWGTSNEYHKADYSQVIEGKPIHTNQFQARPNDETKSLIEYLNSKNISVMLFSPISALEDDVLFSLKYGPSAKYLNSIIKYYLNNYIYGKKNVLMVGSLSGSSLEENIRLFNSKEVLSEEENNWLRANYFKMELRPM